jgi:hypothetical protein
MTASIGAYVQCSGVDDTALARSGSIIVCIGMIHVFFDLRITFNRISKAYEENRYAGGLEDMIESFELPESRAKKKAEQNRMSASNPAVLFDMAILVSGTLLWGFGDLLK